MRFKPEPARTSNRIKSMLFFVVLFGFMLFSMLLFLRPSHSDVEKRDLAAFPSFSLQTLANGTYFDDISTWFADTFPAKDAFVSLNARVKSLYGFGTRIYGEIQTGDDIPDTPYTGKTSSENDA